MARKKSEFVCELDGLPVTFWRGGVWKHVGNQHARSCGRPPKVVTRVAYDEMMDGVVKAMRYAMGNRLKGKDQT